MGWTDDEHQGQAERLPGGWRGRCDCGWIGPSHVTATVLDPSLPPDVEEAIHRAWVAHLPPPSLRALRRAAAAARITQKQLEAAVRAARVDGRSWADIGAAAGISRQSAHERWGPDTSPEAPISKERPRSRHMTKTPGDDRYTDAILVAVWDGLGRNVAIRDGVLEEMEPTDRENVWRQVAEARERITKRAR